MRRGRFVAQLVLRCLLVPAVALSVVLLAASSPARAQAPLPDLIVNQQILQNHWIVRDEDFLSTTCSVQEGGITPGTHRVLRFTVNTPNIGNANLALGDPNAHVAPINDGLYEFATCHRHFHFRHYTLDELIDPRTGFAWRVAKRGFCMIDVLPAPPNLGGPPPGSPVFRSCGRVGIPGNQGIKAGWADEYIWFLGGQYFVLDGGDGQPPVPPGTYIIRVTVNPGFIPSGGPDDPCRFADPNHTGVCHQLPESNYENNVAQAIVNIPDHPGRGGVGPGVNDPPGPPGERDEHGDLIEP